jgi:hypothetical protein
MILFNLAEYQVRNGRDGYRWDGEAWFGKDLDRLVVKTEGEGVLAGRSGTYMETAKFRRSTVVHSTLIGTSRRVSVTISNPTHPVLMRRSVLRGGALLV